MDPALRLQRPPEPPPRLPLRELDTLWLQVAGTLCNLACRHCFISCGPKNTSHPLMSVAQVEDAVLAAVDAGVREFYFTGGEPFVHPQIFEIIEFTLRRGPVSILTNGLFFDQTSAARLRALFDAAPYSLDLRVSLDGATAEENDPIRGPGTFEQIVDGIVQLDAVGLLPVVTVTDLADEPDPGLHARFAALLRGHGVRRVRLKILRPFRIGREARRGRGYRDDERLVESDLAELGGDHLQCSSCRMVTARGWWPCPILVEDESARLGDTLGDALRPIELRQSACHTCHVEGVSCRT